MSAAGPPQGAKAPLGGSDPHAVGESGGHMSKAAYEINGDPATREAFYAIACDPRRSVAVEACAGAGKTWMLVSRIVRALLDGAESHEILAITFTKKAAGEMRQRLQEWLADFARETEPQKLVEALISRGIGHFPASNGHEALQNLYQSVLAADRPVQIRTFHSWFAALLRTAPLAVLQQLGLPGHYELLESDDEAVAALWRPFQASVAADPALRADYASVAAEHGRAQTQKALAAALNRRTEFVLADEAGVVEASVPPFSALWPELADLAAPADALRGDAARQRWLAWAAELGRESGKTAPKAADAVADAWTLDDAEARLRVLRKAFFVADEDRLTTHLQKFPAAQAAEAELQRLCQATRQHAAWQHQQRMARLTRCLLLEYGMLKRARGWVDMNDIERAAQVLLADPVLSGWVQERLDARIKHLLIDEFQDTNPLQWQALHAWLSGYTGAGAAPGVFIVGDPKQSIYRFRRAEPQVFKAAQAFIRDGLGGDLLACDHTRRNAPAVIGAVNAVMLQAQAEGAWNGYRSHTTESTAAGRVLRLPPIPRPFKAGKDDAPDAAELPWRDSLTTPRETPEETLRTMEARQAARWVAAQIEAGTPPKEIMVLARQRNRLSPLADELRLLGIATVQPEKADLAEAPEVADLVALLDVLVSPAHDLSLARALKSPLFGASDADLTALALLRRAEAHPGRPWLALLLAEADHLPPTLQAAATALALYTTWVHSLPPHDALDAIYHHGDVLARFAAAARPEQRQAVLANLRALLTTALAQGGGRYLTPYALVRALRQGGIPAPGRADPAAVRLLTIHGAKGLEADAVLMLDTDAPPAAADSMGVLVDWPGEAPAPRRFVFLASETSPPPSATDTLAAELAERAREEINALYVAMTRARQVLALSAVEPHRDSGRSPWRRIEPQAQAVEVPERAAAATPDAPDTQEAAAETFFMPFVPVPSVEGSQAAIEDEGIETRSDVARLGEAMHWLLEHGAVEAAEGLESAGSPAATPGASPAHLAFVTRAAREFELPLDAVRQAATMARRIRTGEGRWAWDSTVIDWQGNEVTLLHAGVTQRIDRLVRRRDTGEWWVLDYKSAPRPEEQPGLVEQMNRYRDAMRNANPGATVRVAFLTGEGRVVEVGNERGA
jgi:ATP-dependent helicase/nuclease subunit A